jgi:hypothetical protein
MLHTLLIHHLSYFFSCGEGYLISFLSSALVVLFAFFVFIFLPLLLVGALYPRSNQDVSAGVLGYLLTVLFEKKGGAEPEFSIFSLSLQSHRGLFVYCNCLTRSEVLVSGAL